MSNTKDKSDAPPKSVAALRASLALSVPNPKAASISTQSADQVSIRINLTELEPYSRNIRSSKNEKYAEIKESIRKNGLLSQLAVTQRPGEKKYTLHSGGNTRLHILKELYEETKDLRFFTLDVILKPWTRESDVLINHFMENELRGDLSFWDKATGMKALSDLLESENGGLKLNAAQLKKEAEARGISYSTTTINTYLDAARRLSFVGPLMSHKDAEKALPLIRGIESQSRKFNLPEYEFNEQIVGFFSDYSEKAEASQEFSIAPFIQALLGFSSETFNCAPEKLAELIGYAEDRSEPKQPPTVESAAAPSLLPQKNTVTSKRDRTKQKASTSSEADELVPALREFATLTKLQDCIFLLETMPRRIFVDFPKSPFHEDVEADHELTLRLAAWKILAALSLQTTSDYIGVPSPDATTWGRLVAQNGIDSIEQHFISLADGFCETAAPLALTADELSSVFINPAISQVAMHLIAVLNKHDRKRGAA